MEAPTFKSVNNYSEVKGLFAPIHSKNMNFVRIIYRNSSKSSVLCVPKPRSKLTAVRNIQQDAGATSPSRKMSVLRLLPLSFGIGTAVGIVYNQWCPEEMKLRFTSALAARHSTKDEFNFIADVVDAALPSVVTINVNKSSLGVADVNASGFIISPDGYILTNAHVFPVFGGFTSYVTLWDGRRYSATVEAIDVDKDLALLKVDEKNLPVTKLGQSGDVRVGEWVVAIGSPLSLKCTVTARVVSNAHRRASEIGIRRRVAEYIQTDTAITYGNSGGPLLNLDAEAIGINTMMMVPGIAFAIPMDTVKEFLHAVETKKKGTYQEPKKRVLGMKMLSLSQEIIEALEQRGKYFIPVATGVMVFDVFANSPAAQGGLLRGDIIVSVNDKAVSYVDDVYDALYSGPVLKFKVLREGREILLNVTPQTL